MDGSHCGKAEGAGFEGRSRTTSGLGGAAGRRDFEGQRASADIAVDIRRHGIEVWTATIPDPVERSWNAIPSYDEGCRGSSHWYRSKPPSRLALVILADAALIRSTKSMKHTVLRRSIGRGLARSSQTQPDLR